METTVTDVATVGPDTVALALETPPDLDAEPGQFVRLDATVDGESYGRFYSISSPDVADRLEVTVEVDPELAGPFSGYLAALAPGDEITMAGPFGDVHYAGEARPVVLAAGPGVGPAVAIGERAHADGGDPAVVYRGDEPAHRDRLDALADAGHEVRVVDDGGFDAAVAAAAGGGPDEQVFVYGFDDLVDDALAALAAAGHDPDDAKVESFG